MDFLQLLQQANSNQATAKKKLEKERAKKDQERCVEKMKEELQRKQAAVRLKEARDEDYSKKMRYKGLVPLPAAKNEDHSTILPSPIHMTSQSPTSKKTSKTSKTPSGKSASAFSKTPSSKTASGKTSSASSKTASGKTSSASNIKSGKTSASNKAAPGKPSSKTSSSKTVRKEVGGSGQSDKTGSAGSHRVAATGKASHNLLTAQRARIGQEGREKAKSISPFRGGSKKASGGDGMNSGMAGGAGVTAAARRDGKEVSGKQNKATNFQDLIKMAAHNSSAGTTQERESVSGGKAGPAVVPSSRDHSPMGKSLLDRGRTKGSRDRSPMVKSLLDRGRTKGHSSSRDHSPVGKSLLEKGCRGDGRRGPPSKLTPPTKTEESKQSQSVGGRSGGGGGGGGGGVVKGGTHGVKDGRGSEVAQNGEGSKAVLTRRPLRAPPPDKTGRRGDVLPNRANARGQSSRLPAKSAGASSFYGAAAANILRQQGRSKPFAGSGGKYTSTWVDEMSEYMHSEMAGDEEDDYSDLEGFVESDDEFVDDGDDGMANDYSAEIRKLFRYDPSRFNDGGFDDGAMESSFAQQEFEEIRSGRIGHMEDEEELARERAAIKRKKQTKHKPSLKQSKLSF